MRVSHGHHHLLGKVLKLELRTLAKLVVLLESFTHIFPRVGP